jgi:hypothetical protein
VFTVGVDRALGRLRTNFNYWSTQDGDARRGSIGSTGWSLSDLRVFSTFTLGADVMHTRHHVARLARQVGRKSAMELSRFLAAGFDIRATRG